MAEITVRSELNAIVWKIEVVVGATTGEGDILIILESMKMEIPVSAPLGGKIVSILVAVGDTISEGDEVAIIEG